MFKVLWKCGDEKIDAEVAEFAARGNPEHLQDAIYRAKERAERNEGAANTRTEAARLWAVVAVVAAQSAADVSTEYKNARTYHDAEVYCASVDEALGELRKAAEKCFDWVIKERATAPANMRRAVEVLAAAYRAFDAAWTIYDTVEAAMEAAGHRVFADAPPPRQDDGDDGSPA